MIETEKEANQVPDLHIFKTAIGMADPVALMNQNVAIHYVQNLYYRRVDFLEGIPEFQCVNMGAVLATNQSGRTNVINLELADNEFGIFRFYPIDDFQLLLFHPSGIAKFQMRNLAVPLDLQILINDPNLVTTEIGVWQNNRPAMIAVNANAIALAASRVRAIGYRFHVDTCLPITQDEKRVIQALKSESHYTAKNDDELMELALAQGRLPVTHIWCSGRGIGD